MQKTFDEPKEPMPHDHFQVPTKAEILLALQHESGRGGFQVEWLLDRCETRERSK